ncbi:hypothetical protein [Carbonactinospora thermoautotrophica]|uniref:hypothetical protein n=1 Tax=Carbonactinospora thermoautotrophica TaxID=1469144 RepID=UPI000B2B0143|nr:hypothetical protein [Carbonactinospora thermoautotrophica]
MASTEPRRRGDDLAGQTDGWAEPRYTALDILANNCLAVITGAGNDEKKPPKRSSHRLRPRITGDRLTHHTSPDVATTI